MSKFLAKRKNHWAGGLGSRIVTLPSLRLWLLAHRVTMFKNSLCGLRKLFVLSSSTLLYSIHCWPMKASFPFSNKNFVVVFCFNTCIEILTIWGQLYSLFSNRLLDDELYLDLKSWTLEYKLIIRLVLEFHLWGRKRVCINLWKRNLYFHRKEQFKMNVQK